MKRMLLASIVALTATSGAMFAQGGRIASPEGSAATEIGGKYVKGGDEPVYEGGKWIEVTYGRPIKRARDLWGTGSDYGKNLLAGAPIWRAGANVTTQLKTELPLMIGGKPVAPGRYSLFIDLKPNNWTLAVSGWPAQTTYDPKNSQALWGSYGYTAAKDVARAPMVLTPLAFSVDQLTWSFTDMTDAGGKLAIMWDKTMASVPFTVSK
jgi:hypothetical protein